MPIAESVIPISTASIPSLAGLSGPARLSHMRLLEAESIHILREVASEFERPVMLYSIGKDSSVMLRLAQKAFFPGPIPFPLLHIDTGFKFADYNGSALLGAIRAACRAWKDRRAWTAMMVRGMGKDFSWTASAGEYSRLYRKLHPGEHPETLIF